MKDKIEQAIQDVLKMNSDFSMDDYAQKDASALDRYMLRTAFRLYKYVKKYRSGMVSKKDVLVSLRNYLLLFQTDVYLPEDIDLEYEHLGLKIDGLGKCYAVMDFPEYLNDKIVEQAFMRGTVNTSKEEGFLGVSPNVFRITGFKQYKTLAQKIAVTGALNLPDGYTALISLPTGGGKSLITQTMAYQSTNGLTVVVVPTVSLAMDQERVARENIRIAKDGEIYCYYSALKEEEKKNIYEKLADHSLRLLFISPEAIIKNERFRKSIDEANTTGYLKNIIIDEAHIVIEWGTFFRVDYQCLEPWRNSLVQMNDNLKTILLSATFEKETVHMLKSMFSYTDKWVEIRCDSLRKEPRFSLIRAASHTDKRRKLIELMDCLPRPMVIYVTTPYQAEKIKTIAKEIGYHNVVTFTGATKSDERRRIIKGWSEDEFDIVIATSAFGVGVDKPDVRTVLHMYVPENANKYYQELGRGGRDGLPSLSVMCVFPEEDLDSAFYLTTKVLSTEKIIGRWNSMLNSPTSPRYLNTYSLNTAVKPNYREADYAEDANTADIKWNVYVILLLRRRGLIKITDMIIDPTTQNYMIRVEILNELLLKNGQEMRNLIEKIRSEEWAKNEAEFRMMSIAVNIGNNMCWSEMFFDTYSSVSVYCAGCDNHLHVIDEERNRFKLLKTISSPVRAASPQVQQLLGGANEAVMICDLDNYELLSKVLNQGFQLVVMDDQSTDVYMDILLNLHCESDINFMGMTEYVRMLEKNNYYYVSGTAVIIYNRQTQSLYKKLTKVRNLALRGNIKLLHIFEKNFYFSESEKDAVSIIDGPVLEEYDMERI